MHWREGTQIAEAAAWEQHGRRHSTFYIMRPFILPGVIATALAGVGYGAYRAWHWLTAGPSGDGVPTLMWVLLAFLFVSTVLAAKGTGRARPFGVLAVLTLGIGAAWLFWLGALLSMLM